MLVMEFSLRKEKIRRGLTQHGPSQRHVDEVKTRFGPNSSRCFGDICKDAQQCMEPFIPCPKIQR